MLLNRIEKITWLIGLLLLISMLLFLVGCGSKDTDGIEEPDSTEASQQTDAKVANENSGVDPLIIQVLYDSQMGESWNRQFQQGAQEVLNGVQGGSYMNESEMGADWSMKEAVKQAALEGHDGTLVAADPEKENAEETIQQTREEGVPTFSFADHITNGYNAAAPKEMAKSMTRVLVAFVALQRGSAAWNDGDDFSKQLENAVRGRWSVVNSSGDWKSFAPPYVMEFCKGRSGHDEMNRVSLIENIDDTPDGNGYDYTLNTGNHYYLFPKTPDTLECHWEPDGYSASDSLMRVEEISDEGSDSSSNYVFDMNLYKENTAERFRGTISKFTGYGAMGDPEECYALNLDSPLRVLTTDGKDIVLHAIQLNFDESLDNYADKGTVVNINGELFEAHTDHHFTPVLLDVYNVKN